MPCSRLFHLGLFWRIRLISSLVAWVTLTVLSGPSYPVSIKITDPALTYLRKGWRPEWSDDLLWVLLVRSSLIDELNAPYVKTAVAKGLPLWRILGVHTYVNAAVPTLTMIGWEVTRSLAGHTIIVETVFAWPGLGLAAIQAIQREDILLLQAIVFVVALMVVIINLALDLLYKFIDPRFSV